MELAKSTFLVFEQENGKHSPSLTEPMPPRTRNELHTSVGESEGEPGEGKAS